MGQYFGSPVFAACHGLANMLAAGLKWVKARFYYERRMEYSLFLLLIFLLCLALAQILNTERLMKQTKNTPFVARSGNEPLS